MLCLRKDPRTALTAEGMTDCKGVDMEDITASDIERFNSKIKKTKSCWLWTAPLDNGYGRFWLNGRTQISHRVSYVLIHGREIPKGFQLDHLCRNRACVNPDHLEPVTIKENVLRGVGLSALNARKTICKNGHQLSGDNMYILKRGGRVCRTCQINRVRRWRAKVSA